MPRPERIDPHPDPRAVRRRRRVDWNLWLRVVFTLAAWVSAALIVGLVVALQLAATVAR